MVLVLILIIWFSACLCKSVLQRGGGKNPDYVSDINVVCVFISLQCGRQIAQLKEEYEESKKTLEAEASKLRQVRTEDRQDGEHALTEKANGCAECSRLQTCWLTVRFPRLGQNHRKDRHQRDETSIYYWICTVFSWGGVSSFTFSFIFYTPVSFKGISVVLR